MASLKIRATLTALIFSTLCGCAVSATGIDERIALGLSSPIVDDDKFVTEISAYPPVGAHVSCNSKRGQGFMISPLVPLPPLIPFPDEVKAVVVYLYLKDPAISYDPTQFGIRKGSLEMRVRSSKMIQIPMKEDRSSGWKGSTALFELETTDCKDLDGSVFQFGAITFEGKAFPVPRLHAEYKGRVRAGASYLSK